MTHGMEMEGFPELKQSTITDHFVHLATGGKPIKKNGIVIIPQKGDGNRNELKIVSPSQEAVEQAHSDLRTGVHHANQVDMFQDAIRQQVNANPLTHSRAAVKRRRSPSKSVKGTKKRKVSKTKKSSSPKKSKKKTTKKTSKKNSKKNKKKR